MESTSPRHAADSAARPAAVKHAYLWTTLGTLVPGLGMIRAGRKVVGGVVLAVWAVALAGVAIGGGLIWSRAQSSGSSRSIPALFTSPSFLVQLAVGAVVVGVLWVLVIGATYLMLRPAAATRGQRVAGSALVSLLAFIVAAPAAVASTYAYSSSQAIKQVFSSEKDTKSATRPTITTAPTADDPWEGIDRVNILLLGGDSGTKRDIKLGVRTDTVIVASIDTRTGDTVLVSLPRGTARMPFPKNGPLYKKFPNGFTNGNPDDGNWMLNALYLEIPNLVNKDILGPTDNLGADALKLSVGEATGLKIDYFVLVNMDGFKKLINALGGIRVNVNSRIPIGGVTDKGIPPIGYIEPGPNKKLNGFKAMWYARGRYGIEGGDFDRMDRQRCVIKAVIDQADPETMLTRYEAIARASKNMIATDIPQERLSAMVDLSLRVKDGNIRSLVFRHQEDGFLVYNPDFRLMRKRVKQAISETRTEGKAKTPASASASSSATATSKATSKSTTKIKSGSENVDDTCAYKPKKK